MNDTEATDLLDRAAQLLIPDEPAPLTSLLIAAKQGQRQRSRRVMLLAAASVALVLGGGAVIQQVAGDSGKPSPDKPSQNLTSDVPTAPEGKVLVGTGRVVVAVPSTWSRMPNGCHIPRGNVYFEPVRAQECWMGSYGGSSGQTQPALGFSMLGQTDITGFTALSGEAAAVADEAICQLSDPGDCRQLIAVPGEDVLLTLRWTEPSDADAIAAEVRDSLHLLPEGYITVPYIEPGTFNYDAADQLSGVGLSLDSPIVGLSDMGTPITGTAPEAGSVVEVGSEVKLLYSDSNSSEAMTVTPSTARPGDVVSLMFPKGTGRGIGFTLAPLWECASDECSGSRPSGFPSYYLTSANTYLGDEPSWSADPVGWRDVGRTGPGPDRVVIPEVAESGRYQLCTANAATQMCVQVIVGGPVGASVSNAVTDVPFGNLSE